ncbi:hypothetical protein [Faunimonas pinastri]|nr:hypothetical protein [Faunimonas pinastri]
MSLAAVLVTAAGLGGCSSGFSTYGTGERPESAIFHEVGGTLTGSKKAKIDYSPRAPLVVPPSDQLPAPAAAPETANAQWPDDPDRRVKKSRYDEANVDIRESYERTKNLPRGTSDNDASSNPGIGAGGRAFTRQDEIDAARSLNSQQTQRKQFKAALAQQNNVAKHRRYLTDPPDTLKQPAPGAPTDFKDVKKQNGGFFSHLF